MSSIEDHGCFTIALSGGSVPKFLANLRSSFEDMSIEPYFDKWHVCLADERLVSSNHEDSNLKALREHLLANVDIPPSQIYGIDETLLEYESDENNPNRSEAIAASYEKNVISKLLSLSNGKLDCAVLGFGPDGHTCSLFPNHSLLKETTKLVASLDDSPKPPPSRITLTFPVLNDTRCVIFCGAGSSKSKVLQDSFSKIVRTDDGGDDYDVLINETKKESDAYSSNIQPYPCAMIKPKSEMLIWIVDEDAAEGLDIMDE